jgi:hypothetical protein
VIGRTEREPGDETIEQDCSSCWMFNTRRAHRRAYLEGTYSIFLMARITSYSEETSRSSSLK